MIEYTNKITALYSRLSVGDEDRDGGESNSIVNQKAFLERYAKQHKLMNIRHYIDDDESGRFFDRSAYTQMISDVEQGKISIVIMKDMTRWGRDYLQLGNVIEISRRNNVRFITINIMSEWYARDISKKVTTGIKTKGASGKPVATEAPYGYIKDPKNKQGQRECKGRKTHCNIVKKRGIEDPYFWTPTTVGYILVKREYRGHTVLGKTICLDYKTKKRRKAKEDEQEFLKVMNKLSDEKREEKYQGDKEKLGKLSSRNAELTTLIIKLYEDHALGKIPVKHFDRLFNIYDTEQQELEKQIQYFDDEIES